MRRAFSPNLPARNIYYWFRSLDIKSSIELNVGLLATGQKSACQAQTTFKCAIGTAQTVASSAEFWSEAAGTKGIDVGMEQLVVWIIRRGMWRRVRILVPVVCFQ
jgi:hypothetical protein